MIVSETSGLESLGGDNYLLTLSVPEGRFAALGRFARLRSWPMPSLGPGTLLDRPFSIHGIGRGTLSFLIRKVGPATALLAGLAKGDPVRVIGPLGTGLDDLDPAFGEKKWYLVAGGAGLGPMGSLMAALGDRARLFYGERSGKSQVGSGYLRGLSRDADGSGIVTTTEDGTGYGLKGLVTEPLLRGLGEEKRPIVACGPPGLLAAAARAALDHGVGYFACAEARMACGLGVCLSCTLPKLDGSNFRVCREGPMVDGLSLDWDRIRA
ncbi:MAG: hypothetical protein LBF58_04395 [Deltaproteobacteria bacterium]|jgi:dihydroorotate dehydrogenase electron transfer subunit|nr:hypothetical protein [Deltaproteobacteria bacterium]